MTQAITLDEVWKLFKETDRKFQETDRRFQDTERLLKEKSLVSCNILLFALKSL
jgi:hypothetical protein